MSDLKIGDRVIVHNGLFGKGVIVDEVRDQVLSDVLYFCVECDNKLPNEYAYNTYRSIFEPKDLKLENGE